MLKKKFVNIFPIRKLRKGMPKFEQYIAGAKNSKSINTAICSNLKKKANMPLSIVEKSSFPLITILL